MDEALGIALARKLEPIEWDEAVALAAAQSRFVSAGSPDGDVAALPTDGEALTKQGMRFASSLFSMPAKVRSEKWKRFSEKTHDKKKS